MLPGMVTGTAFYNTSLKARQKGGEDERKDVSSHWMTSTKTKRAIT